MSAPVCDRPLEAHTKVERWVHDNPRCEGEGALSYIDRIAHACGLIPNSLAPDANEARGGMKKLIGR